MTENELTGLDKEFFDIFLTTWREYEKDKGKLYILKTLSGVGGVVSKEPYRDGGTRFWFKNGETCGVIAGMNHMNYGCLPGDDWVPPDV